MSDEFTTTRIAQRLRDSLLDHGCEAVYGQVDWNAIANDLIQEITNAN